MEISLEMIMLFPAIRLLVKEKKKNINSLTSSQQAPYPGILCIKKHSHLLQCLGFFMGLNLSNYSIWFQENSHMAIYFIYFIFNKMVEWALATMRHKFQSVL